MSSLEARLGGLRGHPSLARLQRGMERETLRISPDGSLSQQPHPRSLGAPLTHPKITTDFCEAQLELITSVHSNVDSCLSELTDIHSYVYQQLDDELLWPASMPCGVGIDEQIPIAKYGRSNAARFKEIYRIGLGNRYGRVMQTISGIHYNFSLPESLWEQLASCDNLTNDQDFHNASYLRLVRNFRKHHWLLIYLFGASPAVCRTFLSGREHSLESLDRTTNYLPHATSLRMGPLGYQSEAQGQQHVSYDDLDGFVHSMVPILNESYEAYRKIGVRVEEDYRQLNDSLLQIEAELYSTIRIKRRTQSGERALAALQREGIEYVEVRCMDIDPFEPIGISADTVRFLDVFLLHSLLSDNEQESLKQSQINLRNQLTVVHEGRRPNLLLEQSHSSRSLEEWGGEILDECMKVASMLDEVCETDAFGNQVQEQMHKLAQPDLTPSAKLQMLMKDRQQPFASLGLELAFEHHRTMTAQGLSNESRGEFERLAKKSHADLAVVESSESEDFETYRNRMLSMHDIQ